MVLSELLHDIASPPVPDGRRELDDLVRVLGVVGPLERPVSGVSHDSRQVGRDGVFVALHGSVHDGHAFVARMGHAAAVVVEREIPVPPGPTRIHVSATRPTLAPLAAAFYGHPARRMPVLAITGTNGKTTTTWLCEAALRAGGLEAAVVGTTGIRFGGAPWFEGRRDPSTHVHTTPEASELQRILALMAAKGCGVVVMEASSIGIEAHRVDAIPFHAAAFTNLTRDHLDVHGSMERYRDAKARLFKELLAPGGRAILNLDDPASGAMRPADRPVWTYGLSEGDFHATGLVGAPHGSVFVARTPEGEVPVRLPMPGRHNVSNALLALALAASLGVDLSSAARGLAAAPQVPGRFERVPDARGFDVLVDFAHTPDALAHALRSLREVTPGRLLLLFGCGGDRDRGKRPEMGRIAADLADLVVVTSDNPRGEDPEAILDAILAGMGGARARVMRDVDRGRAIHTILAEAREGDVVLLAGKGHEDTQEIAGRFLPFDDRSVAAEALLTLRPRAPEGAHP